MRANNFDRVAFIYDALVRIFFGRSVHRAQVHFLNKIEPKATVLILGGGTGWIADELLRINPSVKITFVDASQTMINRAIRRLHDRNVQIICGDENSIPPGPYQVVITPFFFDLFPDQRLAEVFRKIDQHLEPRALWIATDFVSEKWWHRIYLWMMYRFFKVVSAIEADRLPSWQHRLQKPNFILHGTKTFYGGFIRTCSYQTT